jgi:ribonuclease I
MLEYTAKAIGRKALDLECKDRSEDEMKFFAVHGYWPETADVVEPVESCFTTHGLKTTVILQRVEPVRFAPFKR